MRADVIDKNTGNTIEVPGNVIDLSSPSVVRLDLDRSQIASLDRQGNDLIIHLVDGKTIQVANFYVTAKGADNDLVLREGDRLWQADTASTGPARFVSLHRIDELLIGAEATAASGGGGGALLPVLLGAAGVAGGAAALAGGGSGGSSSRTGTIADTTPPTAPTATVNGTGTTVSGSGEAGATVQVRDGSGNILGSSIVGSNGSYSVTLNQPQANGQTVSVTQTDPSGNVSTATTVRGPDITAPGTPTGEVNTTGTVLSGTGEAGATVTVRDPQGNVIGTGVVGSNGSYSITLSTPQIAGSTITVSQTDPAGNASAAANVATPDHTPPLAPTAVMDAATITVSGVGEPGATIKVYDTDGTLIGGTVAEADGGYTVSLPPSSFDGDPVTVTQTDPSGNVSPGTVVTTPDLAVPLAPSATVSADGTEVSGNGEAGATITIVDASDGSPLGTGVVAADGTYRVLLTRILPDGGTVEVTQTDSSGNTSAPTSAVAPDVTGPAAPTAVVTADGTAVHGSGEAGATVTVRDAGGAVLGTAVVAGDGSYFVTITPAQTNGETLSVVQADPTGNASPATIVTALDTTAPEAPVAAVAANGGSVTGTGEAGASVTVRDAQGNVLGTGTVAGDGSFTVTLTTPKANGETLSVDQRDPAGNVSPGTTVTAPDASAPLGLTAGIDSGGTVVSGSGEPGATVTVRDPLGNAIGTGVVASNGSYSVVLTPPQANGETLQVTQADAAGNVSTPVTTIAPDLTAPGAPLGTVSADGTTVSGTGEAGATLTVRDGTGTVIGTTTVLGDGSYSVTLTTPQANGGTLMLVQGDAAGNVSPATSVAAPDITAPLGLTASVNGTGTVVSGSGEPGATVTVRDPGGTVIGTGSVAANGSYSVILSTPQANGGTLQVTQADAAGNPSGPVPAVAPDITAPAAPTATVSPDGTTVSGTGEAGATLVVRDPLGNVIGTTTVLGNGSYSVTLSTAQTNGETVTVRQSDAAGNLSPNGTATAPDSTAPLGLTAAVNGVGTTVSGAGEAGATVTVRDPGGTIIGTATVAANGSYSVILNTPQTNGETLQVTQTDAAGNPSTPVPAMAPDITAPTAPTATVSPDGLTVTGTGEAGATLTVRDPAGAVIGTTTVLGNGSYSVTLATPQTNGEVVTVRQADAAGNVSPIASATAPDITAPLGLTATVNGLGTIVSGSGEAGATVTVRDPLGTVIGTTTVAANGSYSVVLTTPQTNGELLQVTQVDGAANPSAPVPATAPDITAPALPTASVSPDGTTVSGTGEAGATLTVRDPLGNIIGTTTVLGNGSYSVVLTTPQTNGEVVQVRQADAAGNATADVPATAPDITAPIGLTATVNGLGTIVSGSGEAGATVTVRDPLGNAIGTTTVAANGSYSVVLTTPQTNGELLQVTQVDGAANPSTPVPATAPDITAPALPTATVSPDGTTVSGTGEAGATLTVRDPLGNIIGTTTVLGNGSYSVTLTTPQTNGEVVQVRQADAAGNATADVPATAPDITAPIGLTATVNGVGTTVSGTGEAGATVTVRDPLGNAIGTTTVAANGSYSVVLTTPQTNGELLQVTQVDGAANPSTPVPALAPDITAPALPTASVSSDGTTVSGTGEAGATLTVRDPLGNIIGTTTVLGNGSYSVTLTTPQTNGEVVQVRQADAAGNASGDVPAMAPDITAPIGLTATVNGVGTIVSGTGEAGATVTVRDPLGTAIGTATVGSNGAYVVVLTTPQANGELLQVTQVDGAANPSTPVPALAPDITAPTAPSLTVSPDGTTVSGSGEPGATVTITTAGGAIVGSGPVAGNGSFTIILTTPQANGGTLSATQADVAGNVSLPGTAPAPDITPPALPAATLDATGSVVSGTGEPGATVTITDPFATVIGMGTVSAAGTFSITLATPQINNQVLSVVQTDGAGNPSPALPLTAPDLTAPGAPAGIVAADGASISGVGEPGATLVITDPTGTPIGSVTVTGGGTFTTALVPPQINGEQLVLVQTDLAGNVSLPGSATAPDLVPNDSPNAPTATVASDGMTVFGTGDAGDTISVTGANGTVLGTATVTPGGTYIVILTTPQVNGEMLHVVQIDAEGDMSPPATVTAPDLTPPALPTASIDASGSTVTGTGEAGATVRVVNALGTVLGTATVGANGNYAVTLSTPQTNGQALQVIQADAAANDSPAAPVTAPDTTAPTAPTASVSADGATVSGTGESGATVTIRDPLGAAIGTATVTPGGTYTVILTTPQTNGQQLTAVQSDPAGNTSPPTTATAPDTTAPAAPTAAVDASGQLVTGTGEAGATVTVRNALGVPIGTAVVAANGSYSVTLATPQRNGEQLQVVQSDGAGNLSPQTPVTAPDSTAPAAPTGTILADGSAVTGLGEPGATVTVRDASGTAIGTALVAGNGSFTATLTPAQTNGQQLSFSQADAAGNVSPNVPVTAPDTTAPGAPTAAVNANGTVVTGTGEPGATVTVRDALGVPLGTAVVAANGAYAVTLGTPQANGQTLQVRQADAAGNVSGQTPVTAPDITAPLAPAGSVAAGGATLVGTGEPGATVTVRNAGGTVLGTALVAGDGSFTVTLTPPQNNGQQLSLSQADVAGNASPTVPVTAPDTTAPTAPVATINANGAIVSGTGEPGATVTVRNAGGAVLGTAVVAPNGAYAVALTTPQANGQALQVTQADAAGNVSGQTPLTAPDITAPLAPSGSVAVGGATLAGTGEPGATVTVRDAGGTVLGTALVAANGSFTVTLSTLQNNGQQLSLSQSDAAGNASPNVPVTAPDGTAPGAPVATVSGNGAIVSGTGEPGATVTVRDAGGTVLGTALVAANGAYAVSLSTPQANGQVLQVTQADAAGNVSGQTPVTAPDITAPLAPAGSVAAGGATLVGTGEPGATVTVRDAGGTVIGTGLVAANGSFTVTLSSPQNNGQLLTLRQADAAGNVSPSVPVTAPDTTPPAAPLATVAGSGAVVTGTGEPGATVTVRDAGGTVLGTALVAANGAYAVTLSTPQLNGQALQVTQADAAGNVSPIRPATAPDITAPLAPAGSVAAGGATLVGTGEPGATVTVRDAGGTVLGTALVAANGSFTVTLSTPQTNGQVLTLSQADGAGNVSPNVPVTAPDTTPPAAPVATVNASGAVVTGTGEAGATVSVRDPQGVLLGTAVVGANGAYVVALSTPQRNGQSLQVTQADAAGNVSPATPALAPDTTPPAAPSATFNANGTIVSGTGEAGATVHIRTAGGVEIGTAVVAANGSYSATLTTPQANGETLQITQNDPAGNVSPAIPATAPDITPPAAPGVAINGAGTVVTGTGEAGTTVEVRNAGGTLLGSATVAANGSYAVALSAAQTAGQALSVTLRDAAGNVSPVSPITAPFDIVAFDNNANAGVHLVPVTTNANLGSANYTALVSLGLLNLNAQVLGTPSVQFTVNPGHSMATTFTYDALLSIGVLSGYSVIIQRFDGTNWVAIDGNGTSSLLQLSLLNGDLVTNQVLAPGQYRAFVAFDGALGVGLLGGLNVTGVDSDFTDVASAQSLPHSGNVITDPGPTGAVDIASPQTQVLSVTINGVTTTIAAGGSTIQGSWGTLVINQNGSYTYTPSASAAAIGHVDSFTYTLIDRSDGELESAKLNISIGSPEITGPPIAVNDAALATATFANVVTTVPAAIDSSFATPTAVLAAQTGTVHDSFTVGANSTANVTLSAIQSSGLSVLPTYTITVTNAQGTVVATITQTAVANLGLGTGVALNLPNLPSGTYNYTVSSTNILGTGYGTNVYVGQTVTHLDQHTLTGSTTVQGELLANDTLGGSFVGVRVQSGGNFVEVGETPLTITGTYGTLTVNETGHYSYTPNAGLSYSGTDPVDSFTYQVIQPNGTVATARLDVTIDINNGVTPTLSVTETHALADAVPLTMFSAGPVAEVPHETAHKLAILDLADGRDNVETLLGRFLEDHRAQDDLSGTAANDAGAAPADHAAPAIAAVPVAEDPLNYLVDPARLDQDKHQHMYVV